MKRGDPNRCHDSVTVQYKAETIAAESLPRPFRLLKAGPCVTINDRRQTSRAWIYRCFGAFIASLLKLPTQPSRSPYQDSWNVTFKKSGCHDPAIVNSAPLNLRRSGFLHKAHTASISLSKPRSPG